MIVWLSTVHLLGYIFLAYWLGFFTALLLVWLHGRREDEELWNIALIQPDGTMIVDTVLDMDGNPIDWEAAGMRNGRISVRSGD